jgi:chemotaxis protein CheZ
MARASRELQAISTGTERATHTILRAAENIDETVNTLSAALKSSHEQELAQDIRDSVIQIFEACNFQDLTGQHIALVTTTLAFVEKQIAEMLRVCDGAPLETGASDAGSESGWKMLNGPRLADDCGHSTQTEIDLMFRCA